MKRTGEFFRGCLLGGAIGDALGWPVEFLTYNDILSRYGGNGISDLQPSPAGTAEITDDTQMTLFTAEGILRAETKRRDRGLCHTPTMVYHAYQRWLHTQGYSRAEEFDWVYDGWLLKVDLLYKSRAPGQTCLTALFHRWQGTMETPINGSKGCGGIMRMAPAGLYYPREKAFKMGADFAALTHGHPSGFLSAGALSYLIACIIEGQKLEEAVENTLLALKGYLCHEECTKQLTLALKLSHSSLPDIKAIARLGEGWTGEQTLGISVYCALKYRDDFTQALIAAVNHSGDSDSTGAVTGNILGAYLGLDNIPHHWKETVELGDVIIQTADDLLTGFQDSREWRERYPGY